MGRGHGRVPAVYADRLRPRPGLAARLRHVLRLWRPRGNKVTQGGQKRQTENVRDRQTERQKDRQTEIT